MFRKVIFTIAVSFFAAPLFAVTVGELQPGGGTVASRGGELAPLTIINFSRPALASGSVDRATVIWTSAPTAGCTEAFEIKFFRPLSNGVQVLAERGPFSARTGINNVQLTPAVAIQAGDLIGITQLRPVSCGGVVNRRTDRHETWGSIERDPAAGSMVTDIAFTHGLVPSLRASDETSPVYGYLPVVGSLQGNFDSFFRTGIQLTNRGGVEITGRLLYHPAGATGHSSDPQIVYTLGPNQTQSVEDIVAAMGVSGIGSIDIIPTTGYPPDVTARIYNDAGVEGTSGFTEEAMTPYQALYRFDRGSLTIPADLTNFRMNVGVRTLDENVSINIIEYNASGVSTGTFLNRVYPPNYFEQISLSQFLNGEAVAPGGYIVVQVESGSLFVYGAVTDNRTNDGSIRFPTKY